RLVSKRGGGLLPDEGPIGLGLCDRPLHGGPVCPAPGLSSPGDQGLRATGHSPLFGWVADPFPLPPHLEDPPSIPLQVPEKIPGLDQRSHGEAAAPDLR